MSTSRKHRPYRELLLERLGNPIEAEAYLNAAVEDSQCSLLKAVKNVAQAYEMSTVAKQAGVQLETLYRSLSEQGNPTLATLTSILDALGMRIAITTKVSVQEPVVAEPTSVSN
jgi:probable addiction module antidote protein